MILHVWKYFKGIRQQYEIPIWKSRGEGRKHARESEL